MGKRKDKRAGDELYGRIRQVAAANQAPDHTDTAITEVMLANSKDLAFLQASGPEQRRELPKMKKFRFQLLHQWIQTHLKPGRVADVGGGKGLLAYLLQESGWAATVVDPVYQTLPEKYKDLATERQVHLKAEQSVPHHQAVSTLVAATRLGIFAIARPTPVVGSRTCPAGRLHRGLSG